MLLVNPHENAINSKYRRDSISSHNWMSSSVSPSLFAARVCVLGVVVATALHSSGYNEVLF